MLLLLMLVPVTKADYIDPYFEIIKGNVPGHTWVHVKGLDESVATTEYVLWAETVFTWPTSALVMNVSSGSVNDDDGNTGAWNVTIYGLDINYHQINETVIMNGQVGVTTILKYFRINHVEVEHVGAAEQNVGIIYIGTGAIVAGKPAVVYNEIPAGFGISSTSTYTIPDGKKGYMKYFAFGTDSTKIIELSMKTRCVDCVNNSWSVDYHDHFQEPGKIHDLPIPFPLLEHTDLKITARNSVGSAFGTVDMFIILVDDGYTLITDTPGRIGGWNVLWLPVIIIAVLVLALAGRRR